MRGPRRAIPGGCGRVAKKKRPLSHTAWEGPLVTINAALLGPDSRARKPPAAQSEAEGVGKEEGAVCHQRTNSISELRSVKPLLVGGS